MTGPTTGWHTHPGPDIRPIYEQIMDTLTRVRGIDDRVYLSHVPDTVPVSSTGLTLPYTVVWPSPGTPVTDDDRSGVLYQAGQSGEFTVTVASGDHWWTTQAAADVRHALTGALDGAVQPGRFQQRFAQVMRDPAERPGRHYIPLTFTFKKHA